MQKPTLVNNIDLLRSEHGNFRSFLLNLKFYGGDEILLRMQACKSRVELQNPEGSDGVKAPQEQQRCIEILLLATTC
jgi:hypothetical protein